MASVYDLAEDLARLVNGQAPASRLNSNSSTSNQSGSTAGEGPAAGGTVGRTARDAGGPARSNEVKPPPGITGGKFPNGVKVGQVTVKIDWLNLVGPAADREKVQGLMECWFGDGQDLEHGFNTYQKCRAWSGGGKLLWAENRADCCLSLNGDAVDLIPVEDQLGLLKVLLAEGWHLSKVDLAGDAPRSLLSMDDVHAAGAAGDFVGFRLYNPMRPTKRAKGQMVLTGDQANFGQKGKDGSGVAYSIYDKGLESKGQIDAIRIEAKFSKQRAKLLGEQLAAAGDLGELARRIATAIGGNIDFRTRGQEKNLDRMPRKAWWQAVLVELGNAPAIRIPRVVPPLQRTVAAGNGQYGDAWAMQLMVSESKGEDFIGILMRHLRERQQKLDYRKWGKRDLDSDLAAALSG